MDPVTLSVTSAALAGIAEEMGTVLVRSAFSSNIKERRDCSAALFDARGRMVAQAEHIPVHLGAMPESVAAVIALGPQPGEIWILNDPFAGGSHLPDITLVTPLALDGEIRYACTRAHHSDVGGIVPGSMPAALDLDLAGGPDHPARPPRRRRSLRVLLANVRTPEIRRADLAAQVGGEPASRDERLAELRFPLDGGVRRGDRLRRSAAPARRSRAFPTAATRPRARSRRRVSEDDLPIRVAVTIAGDRIEIDFEGTAPAAAGT